ncbi:MAG: glycine-rich domain-containing protein-like [Verrucomicrobiales bacterium]
MPTNQALWKRLEGFEPDAAGAALSFSQRLARENGWSQDFARRAIAEYKRFIYLAIEAGHPVTPSVQVDLVWHLHLCYTRSYWEDLCGDVLGRPLHHGPTRGGGREDAKFRDWYAKTLDAYRAQFGSEPPEDIWPAADLRFDRRAQPRWVNARDHWVLPKPRRAAYLGAAAAALALSTAGCFLIETEDQDTTLWLGFGALLFFVFLAFLFRSKGGGGGGWGGGSCGGGGGGCSSGGCSSGCGGGGCGGGCGS